MYRIYRFTLRDLLGLHARIFLVTKLQMSPQEVVNYQGGKYNQHSDKIKQILTTIKATLFRTKLSLIINPRPPTRVRIKTSFIVLNLVHFYRTCLYDINALCNIHPWCCIQSSVFGTSHCACSQERQFSSQINHRVLDGEHRVNYSPPLKS